MSNPHRASKVQHSLATILLQLCFAVLCGTQGPRATAERGRLRVEYAQALGYERSATPCAATFSRVLRRLDEDADGLAITRRSAQTIERNRGRWERRR
ncbi:transposase family protein, partial [Candidatus Poribacteria bacterium]|nr:transposase family protein [Candidatus Poribacteria bacterium]